mmetsp:Transcript_7212/g.18533  ORF Transcript_7212/g.18533 Transcript_7212/m.18533 type:complete len:268 (+) Transcript_7212:371-1174(+)
MAAPPSPAPSDPSASASPSPPSEAPAGGYPLFSKLRTLLFRPGKCLPASSSALAGTQEQCMYERSCHLTKYSRPCDCPAATSTSVSGLLHRQPRMRLTASYSRSSSGTSSSESESDSRIAASKSSSESVSTRTRPRERLAGGGRPPPRGGWRFGDGARAWSSCALRVGRRGASATIGPGSVAAASGCRTRVERRGASAAPLPASLLPRVTRDIAGCGCAAVPRTPSRPCTVRGGQPFPIAWGEICRATQPNATVTAIAVRVARGDES